MSMISILKNTSSTHDAHENQVPAMLLKRRQKALLLNALTVFFISVATLIAINMITSCQETQIIPVAIRDISKGALIKQDDLYYVNVPKNSVFNNVINKDLIKNAIIATCNIKYGMPIFTSQITQQAKIPPGFTTISIKLASNNQDLNIGENISIAFSKVSRGDNNENDIVQENKNISFIHDVIVVKAGNSSQNALLAMPAESALQIINTQSIIPNLAVIAIRG